MKWIGQQIYDEIARFRNDVYLESISTGTIASGGNLGLDSNNKIVKATETTGDITGVALTASDGIDLTSVSGATGGDYAATIAVDVSDFMTNGADNYVLTATGADAMNAEANLQFNGSALTLTGDFRMTGDTATFTSANADDPAFILQNTTDDDQAARLQFIKSRGADGQDDDNIGEIEFWGYDDGTPSLQQYGKITSEIHDATSGEESGKLSFLVANHDGGLETGLRLTGGSVNSEVDATIGLGAASVTTVAGDLEVTSDLTVNGDTVTFESANADDPQVIIKNTTNDDQAVRLDFQKDRGAAAASGDNIAEIYFTGEDADQNSQIYGRIICQTDVTTDGQESGDFLIGVANHDGGNGYGFRLTGGSVNNEVDATIGYGTSSVTTVAGDLTVTGSDFLFDNVYLTAIQTSGESFADNDTSIMTSAAIDDRKVIGQLAVLRCSAFYLNDNPMVQNSLYFGHSLGSSPWNWNDPAAVGGVIGDTSSFTIDGDDENWGIVLPFNISKVDVQCSMRPQLGTGDDFTVAIYTGTRSSDSSADLTLTKVAHNSVALSSTGNRYTQNDVSVTADYNAGTMIYVGVGSEDSTDMKNGRGYMNITVTRR